MSVASVGLLRRRLRFGLAARLGHGADEGDGRPVFARVIVVAVGMGNCGGELVNGSGEATCGNRNGGGDQDSGERVWARGEEVDGQDIARRFEFYFRADLGPFAHAGPIAHAGPFAHAGPIDDCDIRADSYAPPVGSMAPTTFV